jgi:hypothetical protein
MGVATASVASDPRSAPAIVRRNPDGVLVFRRGSQAANRAAALIADAVDEGFLSREDRGNTWGSATHDVLAAAARGRVIVLRECCIWRFYILLYRDGELVTGDFLRPSAVWGIIRRDSDPASVIRRYIHLLPEPLAEAVRRSDRVWRHDGTPL